MKVNIEEKIKKLNEFRIASGNKSFTTQELKEALRAIISKNESLIQRVMKAFPFEEIGRTRIYEMPKDPIHKSVIEQAYRKQNAAQTSCLKKKSAPKEEISEDAALALLAKKGYQIRKCIGFDLERFAKENPALYKKYLIYETV